MPTAILGSHGSKKYKISVGTVVGPGSGYEQAVTNYTLGRARTARGIRARGIFPKKSLSYAAGPPLIGRRLGRWAAQDGRTVWCEVQYLCYIVKRYETGSAVFYIGKSYINPYVVHPGRPSGTLGRYG